MSATDSVPKTKEDVYFDRNVLACGFVVSNFARGFDAGWWPDTDTVNGEEWAVVWADLTTGQVGWHVPMDMVPDALPKKDPEYDGYTTEEKNERLRQFYDFEVPQ